MATYIEGMHGNFRGKVGKLIGSSWKGEPYIKAIPKKRIQPAHEKEQQNRNKFSMAHWWLHPVKAFVRAGYKGYTDRVEGFNAAKSYCLKNAFEGEGDKMTINPALMKVSYGDLPLPAAITAVKTAPDQLQISWDAVDQSAPDAADQAMVLAYDIENGEATANITGQFRYMGTDTLYINPETLEKTWHIYVAFVAADRSRQSDSVYLGTIKI